MNATPALPPRLDLLCRLVRRQGGEWTRARVERAYAKHLRDAPKHATQRHDLDLLCRMGVLDLRSTPGRRWYVASRTANQTTTRGTA